MALSDALSYLDQNADQRVEELLDLIRIPSVSTDPERAGDVRRAGEWVREALERAGVTATLEETGGHPLVYGERMVSDDLPTVLVYGHFDVQPADELRDGWSHAPFDPVLKDDNVYARGATDDKGQMYCWIKAAEAWDHAGGPPCNLKFLIEGEEEVSSANLGSWIENNLERLSADVVAVSDCDQYGPGMPALTYGLRGILYVEVRCYGQSEDVHSGMFGGAIMNPATALVKVLAQLHDDKGRITVEGFYDEVRPLEAWERESFALLPHDDAAYAKDLGAPEVFGEEGYTTLERTWARPTLELNGLFGGFMEAGAKTVLPSYAGAKVSMRLVPDQDPETILARLRRTIAKLTPPGVRIEVTGPGPGITAIGEERHNPKTHEPDGAKPVVIERESPYVKAACAALEQGFGAEPVFTRCGGSIPVVLTFKEKLGLDTMLLGYGLPDDRPHGPDEKFHIPDFHRGCKTSAAFLQEVANRAGNAQEA
ncbi:MAG: dipeptidase [Planctomycetota bacterium]|jgi:acetylornithine deacetylase/succinyl-diaminopimelate desuccinylase-like protein